MKKKMISGIAAIICIAMIFGILPDNIRQADAASIYVSERIDGGKDERLQFYYDSAWLVSEYWEESYYSETNYTKKNGAARVGGKWYLPAEDFEEYEASYSYKGKKYVPLDTLDESGVFEIDSTKKNVTVDRPYQMKRLIVKMKKGNLTPRHYGAVKCARDNNGLYVLQFSSEEKTKAAYELLKSKKSKVDYVEADRFVSMIEPEKVINGSLPAEAALNAGETDKAYASGMESRSAASGWEQQMLGVDILAQRLKLAGLDSSVTVAIVDTGIDYTHPYLRDYVPNKGYDFINNDYDAYDDNSHGTHVAGIVLSTMSGTSVKLLPIKVLSGSGYGSSLSVSNGILYAAECGADVINLSLGGASSGSGHYEDQAIATAISKGTVVVVAAGNDSSDTAYACPAHNSSAIVVAAIDENKERAYFSNYGKTVDVAAPGVNIYSSIPNGGYAYYSGTSMATPHISGVAALLKKIYPDYNCSAIEKLITDNCVDLGNPGFDVYYGYGVPNVAALGIPVYTDPVQTPAPTGVPGPTPTQATFRPIVTATPVPTATPAPTAAPVLTATPVPTTAPVLTSTPEPTYPPLWDWEDWPWPTWTPIQPTNVPTSQPVQPTKVPVPTSAPINTPGNGDISTSISTSTSYVNGVGEVSIKISAGTGIKNVIISGSDGTEYKYTNEGTGISKTLTLKGKSGSSTVLNIYSYDYYGNVVQSSTVTV